MGSKRATLYATCAFFASLVLEGDNNGYCEKKVVCVVFYFLSAPLIKTDLQEFLCTREKLQMARKKISARALVVVFCGIRIIYFNSRRQDAKRVTSSYSGKRL